LRRTDKVPDFQLRLAKHPRQVGSRIIRCHGTTKALIQYYGIDEPTSPLWKQANLSLEAE
jgi:hypothetical protein